MTLLRLHGNTCRFDLERGRITIRGKAHKLVGNMERRSQTAYPNLLPKDNEIEPGDFGKVKCIKATLFYRSLISVILGVSLHLPAGS
jgi:hypothetical protein